MYLIQLESIEKLFNPFRTLKYTEITLYGKEFPTQHPRATHFTIVDQAERIQFAHQGYERVYPTIEKAISEYPLHINPFEKKP